MFKNLIAAAAAVSMVAVPAVASAAPVAQSTALSAGKNLRSGTATSGKSNLNGGSGAIFAIAIVAGIVAIGVIAATKDDNVGTPASR